MGQVNAIITLYYSFIIKLIISIKEIKFFKLYASNFFSYIFIFFIFKTFSKIILLLSSN